MSRPFVYVREVGIHRVPGIRRDERFRLDDLSPGVNIIFGPNGAGKSTTCRVIQELLWPGTLNRPSVDGVIEDVDCEWQIDIDAGHVQCLRDGRPGATPDFGPAESRPRYHLGLKQFIVGDSAEFASRIAQASQGGYDLDAAAEELGFTENPAGPRALRSELRQREEKVLTAQSKQREIEQDARTLADLRKRQQDAAEAGARLELLRKVREYRDAAERCRDLEARLDAFPEGVQRLRGDEQDRLQELSEKERHLDEQLASARDRLRRAETELDELDFPEDGISDGLVRTLRARRNELWDLESKIHDQRQRRDEAAAECENALSKLGKAFSDEQLARMAQLEQPDLSTFARKVDRVRAARATLAERRRWLEAEEPDSLERIDRDELQQGIHALASWLAAGGDDREGMSWRIPAAVAVLVVLIAALAVTQQWIWAIAAVATAVILVLEILSARAGNASDREAHKKTYGRLSLPEPPAWDADGISSHLLQLTKLSGKKVLAAERRMRLEALKEEAHALEADEQTLEARRAELEAKLACTIEAADEWLPVVVDRISDWQSAAARHDAAGTALRKLEAERDRLIEAINEKLAPFDGTEVDSAALADERLADLEDRRQKHASARRDAQEARRSIEETIQSSLDQLSKERSAIFERLELDGDQEAVVADWMARRHDYRECKDQLSQSKTLRDDKKTSLEGHEDLLELDLAELDRRMQEAQAAAEQRDAIAKRIGAIENRIQEAKAGHDLSDALTARDAARDELARVRDENGRARVGAELTDWVRQVAIDRSRPKVFQRADDLFVRFTRGTLQLQMDDRASPPAFLARRGKLPVQALDELSDGERIQLMTAVRLAFLEQDETTPLPLLVDEVLGMSDDGRSEVMIDTIIDVARQGRQVFYCTAQHDEVGKWMARLEAEAIEFRVHNLAQIRQLASAKTNPLEIKRIEKAKPPSPRGLSYEAYGRELDVPGINPRAETIDSVHLWHLFDDADLLYRLLSKDISTWGQLETLLEHGGAGLIRADDAVFEGARAAAKAIETAYEVWRIGRGKPVDRAVLMDSGCVSDRFIDEVTELAARLGGNAQEIIHGLEQREVSGFYTSNIESLRDYFEAEGYLPHEAPLDAEGVRVRVLAAVAGDLKRGVVSQDLLERIAAAVCSREPIRSAAA